MLALAQVLYVRERVRSGAGAGISLCVGSDTHWGIGVDIGSGVCWGSGACAAQVSELELVHWCGHRLRYQMSEKESVRELVLASCILCLIVFCHSVARAGDFVITFVLNCCICVFISLEYVWCELKHSLLRMTLVRMARVNIR